jgi:hypothetical protein
LSFLLEMELSAQVWKAWAALVCELMPAGDLNTTS